MSEKSIQLKNEQELSRQTLVENTKLLDTINRQLILKRMELQTLEEHIAEKAKRGEIMENEAKRRFQEAGNRLVEVAAKEVILDEKDKKLHEKELQLADRESTIGRAYRETVARGGHIDG